MAKTVVTWLLSVLAGVVLLDCGGGGAPPLPISPTLPALAASDSAAPAVVVATPDAGAQSALARALSSSEGDQTRDELLAACNSVIEMSRAGTPLGPPVIDALWDVFSRFQLSKTSSQRLYKTIHDAILQVKDPSWGDKAIDKLSGVVPPNASVDIQKDQLMWWQPTSIQLLSELRYTRAVKPLIVTLLTPTKTGTLGATIQFALLKMARDAEPELIKALEGTDPDYNLPGWDDQANLGVIARVLGQLGRPAGRDAILSVLPRVDTATARTELAQALTQLPADPRNEPAYLDAHKRVPWGSADALLGPLEPRIALAQSSAGFYDPKLVDWLLAGMKGAPDYSGRCLQLEAEVKLMTPDREAAVHKALASLEKEMPASGFAQVQHMWDAADAALRRCKADVTCYVGLLDEPIPTQPPAAYYKQVKAAWMAVIYGSGNAPGTRSALLSKVDSVKNAGARIALVAAIDRLAPSGDLATADALDQIVAADVKADDKLLVAVDNTVSQVAWRLRVRGQ